MNSEHYRLEALKLAVDVYKFNTQMWMNVSQDFKQIGIKELFDVYYEVIMQDAVKAEEEAKKAKEPQYKMPPNLRTPIQ
jgi:hypothetical protein